MLHHALARPSLRVVTAAAVAATVLTSSPPATATPASSAPIKARRVANPLPLGPATLPESRTSTAIAPGVTRTVIVRGAARARASQLATTPYGPWRINVVRIDPRTARARLQTTFGSNLAVTETTSTLARWAGALVGMNGSYFAFSRSRLYPGDPTGLTVHAGTVLSEPTGTAAEQNVLIDADTMRLRMGRLSWTSTLTNPRTGRALSLDGVNTALPAPVGCATLPTPSMCTAPGRTVRLTPQFARSTPTGRGVEVVLDRRGCVVRTALTRGTRIGATDTSIQATGADAAALAGFTRAGDCLRTAEVVRDERRRPVPIGRTTYGVTGRYRLVADGSVVAPVLRNSLSARNPRSLIGRTADGAVVLATVDGRSTSSVGTTLVETARVAAALGLVDAVNLDGGGSTTLAVAGTKVNTAVTDADDGTSRPVIRERAVSDAIVLVPR